LWLPYQVTDLPATETFLASRLGLSTVDFWERPGESGRVLACEDPGWLGGDDGRPGALVELVTGPVDRAAPPAFELPDRAAVDALYRRFAPAEVTRPPAAYPRGHYGFEVTAPGGFPLMIWSER
jgi:hypothetical protein